jgi:hypothetical protein
MEKEIVTVKKNNLHNTGAKLGLIMRCIIQWAFRFVNKFHKPLWGIRMSSWNS